MSEIFREKIPDNALARIIVNPSSEFQIVKFLVEFLNKRDYLVATELTFRPICYRTQLPELSRSSTPDITAMPLVRLGRLLFPIIEAKNKNSMNLDQINRYVKQFKSVVVAMCSSEYENLECKFKKDIKDKIKHGKLALMLLDPEKSCIGITYSMEYLKNSYFTVRILFQYFLVVHFLLINSSQSALRRLGIFRRDRLCDSIFSNGSTIRNFNKFLYMCLGYTVKEVKLVGLKCESIKFKKKFLGGYATIEWNSSSLLDCIINRLYELYNYSQGNHSQNIPRKLIEEYSEKFEDLWIRCLPMFQDVLAFPEFFEDFINRIIESSRERSSILQQFRRLENILKMGHRSDVEILRNVVKTVFRKIILQ